jgi:hypothetical protein
MGPASLKEKNRYSLNPARALAPHLSSLHFLTSFNPKAKGRETKIG